MGFRRMRSGETVLAAYSSRSRVVLGDAGGIEVSWGALSVAMSGAEFAGFAEMLTDAAGCPVRCGELARCFCGRVSRCAMGEVSLSHNGLTLWFSPEEFEEFGRLVLAARRKLSDLAPLSPLGVPWEPGEEFFTSN
ncbi:MAG: hypothetical protein ACRDSJ_12505 [Rubrobacteraceae bacterium]